MYSISSALEPPVGRLVAITVPSKTAEEFLIASLGGAAIGFVVFVIVAKLRRLVTEPVLDTAISFVVPVVTYTLQPGRGGAWRR